MRPVICQRGDLLPSTAGWREQNDLLIEVIGSLSDEEFAWSLAPSIEELDTEQARGQVKAPMSQFMWSGPNPGRDRQTELSPRAKVAMPRRSHRASLSRKPGLSRFPPTRCLGSRPR